MQLYIRDYTLSTPFIYEKSRHCRQNNAGILKKGDKKKEKEKGRIHFYIIARQKLEINRII